MTCDRILDAASASSSVAKSSTMFRVSVSQISNAMLPHGRALPALLRACAIRLTGAICPSVAPGCRNQSAVSW